VYEDALRINANSADTLYNHGCAYRSHAAVASRDSQLNVKNLNFNLFD